MACKKACLTCGGGEGSLRKRSNMQKSFFYHYLRVAGSISIKDSRLYRICVGLVSNRTKNQHFQNHGNWIIKNMRKKHNQESIELLQESLSLKFIGKFYFPKLTTRAIRYGRMD